ncbi:hypothetical protein FBU59_002889 [Linderina macrospora]|uniref:Uncharacterized protein n=1 Tax=Linderina macrospora TaxID=4868 RepID=A0ACC1JA72_9FUNG|nr:hypothetical protein FBU59_002889 [Linderina macrospora]
MSASPSTHDDTDSLGRRHMVIDLALANILSKDKDIEVLQQQNDNLRVQLSLLREEADLWRAKAEHATQQLQGGIVDVIPQPATGLKKEYVERLFDMNLGKSAYYVGSAKHFFSAIHVEATEVAKAQYAEISEELGGSTVPWANVPSARRSAMAGELVRRVHRFCPIMVRASGNWIAMWFMKTAWAAFGESERKRQEQEQEHEHEHEHEETDEGSLVEWDPTYEPDVIQAELDQARAAAVDTENIEMEIASPLVASGKSKRRRTVSPRK